MGDVITEVSKYQVGWKGGLPETPCGSGSRLSNTARQREWIPHLFRKYTIGTVADIGAGDLNWIGHMDMDGVDYTAYDLVPRHPSVQAFDLVQDVPPQVDMIMCLWVLNHFPLEHCRRALANIRASGSKYLLMTDRPIWHDEQPPEIQMPYIEELPLNDKGDRLLLIELC